jgi:hypothetical protein
MRHQPGRPPGPHTVPGRFILAVVIITVILLAGTVTVLLDRFVPSLAEAFSWVMFVVIVVFAGRWILFHRL